MKNISTVVGIGQRFSKYCDNKKRNITLYYLLFVILCCGENCSIVYAEDNMMAIYVSARKIDSVYENIFSCGIHTIVTPPIFLDQVNDNVEKFSWRYTRSEKQYAIFEVSQDVLTRNSSTDLDSPNRRTFLRDTKRSAKKLTYLPSNVGIDHYENSQDISNAIFHSYNADESPLNFQVDIFMYALGRGLCKKISNVDEVKELTDHDGSSQYYIKGVGELFSNSRGKWEIYLLPDQMFMVKHAKFYGENTIKPKFELKTFGFFKNGDCVFPEKSIIRIPLGPDAIEHHFVFDSAEFDFNSHLFHITSQDISGHLPDGALNIGVSSKRKYTSGW